MEATVSSFAGRLVTLKVPTAGGNFADVAGATIRLSRYTKPNPFFGTLVGRYANRIANGEFTLNGKSIRWQRITADALHGCPQGFERRHGRRRSSMAGSLALTLREQGGRKYPGTLTSVVTFPSATTSTQH